MSFLRQLAGETFIYGSGHIFPRLLNYIFLTPFLTNYLSQLDYGKHSIYYTFSGLLMILFTFRLETAFFRFGTKQSQREKYFSTALIFIIGVTIISSLCIGSFSNSIANILTTSIDSRFIWYLLGIISLDAIAAIPFARLRLEQKAKQYAWLKILNVILIISSTLFLFFGLNLLSNWGIAIPASLLDSAYYLDYVFIGNLIGSLVIVIILLLRHFKFKFSIDINSLKSMLNYAWPLIPVGLAGIINMSGDSWLISKLLDGSKEDNIAQSGIYTAAKRIAIIMSLFTTAFNYAVEPFFFRNADNKDAKTMYARTAEAYTITGCLIVLGIIFYLDIFQYILGANFRGGLHIIPIALFSFLFLGLYYNFSAWYKLTDRTIYGMYISFVGVAITILMNIILLPRIGYIGSSIAALCCFITMCILCIYFGRKHYLIPYKFSKIVFYLITTIILIAISTYLPTLFEMSIILKLLFNTGLLALFSFFIYYNEKDGLLKM